MIYVADDPSPVDKEWFRLWADTTRELRAFAGSGFPDGFKGPILIHAKRRAMALTLGAKTPMMVARDLDRMLGR